MLPFIEALALWSPPFWSPSFWSPGLVEARARVRVEAWALDRKPPGDCLLLTLASAVSREGEGSRDRAAFDGEARPRSSGEASKINRTTPSTVDTAFVNRVEPGWARVRVRTWIVGVATWLLSRRGATSSLAMARGQDDSPGATGRPGHGAADSSLKLRPVRRNCPDHHLSHRLELEHGAIGHRRDLGCEQLFESFSASSVAAGTRDGFKVGCCECTRSRAGRHRGRSGSCLGSCLRLLRPSSVLDSVQEFLPADEPPAGLGMSLQVGVRVRARASTGGQYLDRHLFETTNPAAISVCGWPAPNMQQRALLESVRGTAGGRSVGLTGSIGRTGSRPA